MSFRFDTDPLIAGSYIVGNRGLGVFGRDIPATGWSGPSYLYHCITLPDDAEKEIRGEIITPPAAGNFFVYENGAFEFTGAPDGQYFFDYRLFVDGIASGIARVDLFVGESLTTLAVTESSDNADFATSAPFVADLSATESGDTVSFEGFTVPFVADLSVLESGDGVWVWASVPPITGISIVDSSDSANFSSSSPPFLLCDVTDSGDGVEFDSTCFVNSALSGFQTLLPPNSTALERVIEFATTPAIDYSVIALANRPETAPAPLLPWLAWENDVLFWRDDWDDAKKRAAIAGSWSLHSRIGTLSAVKDMCNLIGCTFVGAATHPSAPHFDLIFLDDTRFDMPPHTAHLTIAPQTYAGAASAFDGDFLGDGCLAKTDQDKAVVDEIIAGIEAVSRLSDSIYISLTL